MTTFTVGEGRTSSLGFVGDWPRNVTPAEYNGEIILSASATLLTIQSADDSKYYEYTGSFKYTNPAPVGMAMTEVGLSGSLTGADMYSYTDSLANKKLLLSFKKITLTMQQLYEASESGDSLLTLFNGNDDITGSNFNNEDNADGLGNKIKGDVIRAGNGNDIVYGMGGDDSLWGERGNDSLYGGAGNDYLYGGAGNDMLESNQGADTLNGGSGNDSYKLDMSNFVSEKNKITIVDGQGTADNVNLYDSDDDPAGYNSIPMRINGGNDLAFIYYNESSINKSDFLGSATAYCVIKDQYKINGNGFANSIETLNGFNLAGPSNGVSSILTAAKVNFTYNVAGFTYKASDINGTTKNDALMGYNNQDHLFGNAGNDVLFNISLTSNGSVKLDGGAGNDQIYDGIGDNILIGGLGVDILNGDKGNDIYKFLTIKDSGVTPATADVIGDGPLGDGDQVWNSGDKIDLSAIDANAKIAGKQAFTFWSSASANSVWFDSSTSTVFADASGDTKADFAVVVIGVNSLSAADFIL